MISRMLSDNYLENLEKRNGNAPGYRPCAICGKGIKEDKVKYEARVWSSNSFITDLELKNKTPEEIRQCDMDFFPVGTDCLKKYPEVKGYVRKCS